MANQKPTGKSTESSASAKRKTSSKSAALPAAPVKNKVREDYDGDISELEEKEAQKPKRSRSTSSGGSGSSGKKSSSGASRSKKEPVQVFEEDERSRRFVHQFMPYFLMGLAIFTVVCFLLIDVFSNADVDKGVGHVGRGIRNVLCGLFGFGAFFTPVALALLAVGWRQAVERNALLAKIIYAFVSLLMISTFLHVIIRMEAPVWTVGGSWKDMPRKLWDLGVLLDGGGAVGGILGELLYRGIGLVGSTIVTVTFTVVFVIFLCGLTPGYVNTVLRYKFKIWREQRAEKAEIRREEKAEAAEEARIERQAKRAEEEEYRRLEREARKEQMEIEAAERREHLRALKEAEAKRREELKAEAKKAEEQKAEEPQNDKKAEKKGAKNKEKSPETDSPLLIHPSEEQDASVSHIEEEDSGINAYGEEEQIPLIIIPPKQEDHTSEETVKPEDDGVFHSLEKVSPVRSHASEDEFSLDEIFKHEKPVTEAQKAEINRNPVRDGVNAEASDMDMKLLADMKPITDIDEIPELEDGIEEIAVESEEEKEAEYVFPPIDLLAPDTNSHDEDVTSELMDNAQKLMDTLKSFKVGIKEITYSRGPTITRYELKPDVGIRVRSIANLVDDIALSLATTGVRIEAPIPNKPAVGIEVPNQNPSTVFLRSLIDTEKFVGESSKLTACLGADVGGKPMYFNIAKMPHLLIAGATGMGKSVCINSIIVSLLYKARPDEVKLILIDPKKVEFNIYKDIPHLYAPIVSEPAKAAGALASAVAEMERRFELIEEVGVRDIYNYNAVTKDDPDREFMPQMVIIIDELADLMMTAPDAVESSICRLAQKARAAGIHIIIGTQRPSVDVITGLIKANVPSRIAFTVASQVDSRTIIDIAGAEKLIGRGDMLFAPVGAAKPMRVQGAFVHENEVEKIVEFIKAHNRGAKYNDEFVSRIEEEAAKCTAGNKKGGGGGGAVPDGDMDSDGLDPKFREAVKVAVESGRVATSLLQRKLEVGYGRAAKIIDQMEEMGYVSAPEGNKPRKILISKEDFMQMSINDDI